MTVSISSIHDLVLWKSFDLCYAIDFGLYWLLKCIINIITLSVDKLHFHLHVRHLCKWANVLTLKTPWWNFKPCSHLLRMLPCRKYILQKAHMEPQKHNQTSPSFYQWGLAYCQRVFWLNKKHLFKGITFILKESTRFCQYVTTHAHQDFKNCYLWIMS